MTSKYTSPEEDEERLTRNLLAEISDDYDKELVIYSSEDKNRPPHSLVYNNTNTVPNLKSSGFLKIINMGNDIDTHGPGFGGPVFYVVRILNPKPKPLPKNVKYLETNDRYALEFKDGKSIEFDDISENSAKYFRLLTINHGLAVKHTLALNTITTIDTTVEIRNLVKTIKQKIENHELSKRIRIESRYKSAYTLTISP